MNARRLMAIHPERAAKWLGRQDSSLGMAESKSAIEPNHWHAMAVCGAIAFDFKCFTVTDLERFETHSHPLTARVSSCFMELLVLKGRR